MILKENKMGRAILPAMCSIILRTTILTPRELFTACTTTYASQPMCMLICR